MACMIQYEDALLISMCTSNAGTSSSRLDRLTSCIAFNVDESLA